MKRGLIISIFLIFIFTICTATAIQKGYCANVFVTDISPSSVKTNQDFTVGIQIDNCGESIPENVTFQLKDISQYIIVKEPLKKEVGTLGYANSDRFILYHMRITQDAKPGIYSIGYKLTFGRADFMREVTGNFSITVRGEYAELNIASAKTNPTLPRRGQETELTLRIENFGDGTANSIKVYANHSFKGIKETFIGTLDADEEGPAVFTFIPSRSGEFTIPVKIYYKDDFGTQQLETEVNITVLRRESNWLLVIIVILILAAFGAVIYYLLKDKKRKEELIRQLLGKGREHPNKKKKS